MYENLIYIHTYMKNPSRGGSGGGLGRRREGDLHAREPRRELVVRRLSQLGPVCLLDDHGVAARLCFGIKVSWFSAGLVRKLVQKLVDGV